MWHTSTKMKHPYENRVNIPDGITCTFSQHTLECVKGNTHLRRAIRIPGMTVKIEGNDIVFSNSRANKKSIAQIHSQAAHVRNLFEGLAHPFAYELEICNVHFPMTVKLEGNKLIINNFLGEKVSRSAVILPEVDVKIEGSKITIISADVEKAGQTAANIEKATKVTNKDRRIFQDGCFIVKKPEAAKQ